mgnify:CR=1 FL=1|jgi:hypothetical protein|nr:MAG TPA: hypothetical protein [Caudoviricetes sp.]
MESLTLGEIAKTLTFLVGLIGSIKYIKNGTVKSVSKVIDNRLEPIRKEIKNLTEETSKNNLSSIKTDLINLMELADKETISIEQKIRAHELYDYYYKHGGNSYVHDKWERLIKENKL